VEKKGLIKYGIQDECVRGTDIQISKRGASLTHAFFESVPRYLCGVSFDSEQCCTENVERAGDAFHTSTEAEHKEKTNIHNRQTLLPGECKKM
jgi:hypothetical protein